MTSLNNNVYDVISHLALEILLREPLLCLAIKAEGSFQKRRQKE